jgi:RNA recognition motif-containing protein
MRRRLHVGNLPASTTAEELSAKFSQFGIVRSADILLDVNTGRGRRTAIVEMATDAAASAAIARLNMSQLEELTISVSLARS